MKEIIEDELTRTRRHRESRKQRLEAMRKLGLPKVILDTEELIAKMTYTEFELYKKEQAELELQEKKEYCKNNPPKEEIANLIWNKFELWFNKYKNNAKVLYNELSTEHYFVEPWFYGSMPPGAEQEFYQQVLTDKDYWAENYAPVFEICKTRIRDRLKELGHSDA